ncbi:hypothetical protein PM082_023212 [Marasmius tenuissimus]|nr:hypothetical protein PM082_023212 [Marasmius tenuissimus]
MASEQDIAKQFLEPYTSVGQVIVEPITTLLVMFVLYVWTQMDQTFDTFNAVKTNNYIPYFEDLSGGSRPPEWTAQAGLNMFASNMIGCIFDYLMIHRCYVIWGYSRWILYPFAFVALVTNMIAFVVSAITTTAYQHQNYTLLTSSINIINVVVIISAVYASLLTLLTAGHI